jgi:hypothetical protein
MQEPSGGTSFVANSWSQLRGGRASINEAQQVGNNHGPGCEEAFIEQLSDAFYSAVMDPEIQDPEGVKKAFEVLRHQEVFEIFLDNAAPLCR